MIIKRSGCAGFTLVELLIFLGMLTVVSVGAIGLAAKVKAHHHHPVAQTTRS